jgi:hypothetical protein
VAKAAAARAPVASLARTAVSPVILAASRLLAATVSAALAAMCVTASSTAAQKMCSGRFFGKASAGIGDAGARLAALGWWRAKMRVRMLRRAARDGVMLARAFPRQLTA